MNHTIPGGCYCRKVRYEVTLDDPDKDARTSLCHCRNCKKFTGGPFGVTSKIPRSSFKILQGQDSVQIHEADNGAGTILHREFCKDCGSGILEYGVSELKARCPVARLFVVSFCIPEHSDQVSSWADKTTFANATSRRMPATLFISSMELSIVRRICHPRANSSPVSETLGCRRFLVRCPTFLLTFSN